MIPENCFRIALKKGSYKNGVGVGCQELTFVDSMLQSLLLFCFYWLIFGNICNKKQVEK